MARDPITAIQDLDTLKALAKHMRSYEHKLERRNRELLAENARLRGELAPEQIDLMLQRNQEELARLRERVFGSTSERLPSPPEVVEAEKAAKAAKEPQRGHGPTPQPRLPLETVDHELPLSARTCPACGDQMQEMGATEDSELIGVELRKLRRELHRRRKYRCRCMGAIVTAPGPERLIPGGRYSVDFGIMVALDKREDHLPHERQRRRMAREGLEITTQTLCDVEAQVAELLRPSYDLLREYILGADAIGIDETRWRVMAGEGSKQWWVWCLTCDDAAYYAIDPSRGASVPMLLLNDFEGTLICDGYAVYTSLAKKAPTLKLALCWSHARRNFFESRNNYPKECREALHRIDELFVLDRAAPSPNDLEGEAKAEALAARAKVRAELAKPKVDELFEWAREQKGLPSSGLMKAIRYLLDREQELRAYLDDPILPMTNNQTERALRRPVVGRKNHYGSRSQKGTEVAAIVYTIVETCRLCGVDVQEYMRAALHKAIKTPGAALLPQALARARPGAEADGD